MARRTTKPASGKKPKLLSGGNPQITKGYGEAPVQAYIAAADWVKQASRLPGEKM